VTDDPLEGGHDDLIRSVPLKYCIEKAGDEVIRGET